MNALRLFLLILLLTALYYPCSGQTLPRSTPEEQGISSEAILEFVEAADREIDQMHSFMLLRHGKVVAEGWWAPYEAESPHILYSLSKSFTSTAVGLAVEEGKLSIDDPVLQFFPEDAPANPDANLKAMRVSDLLRMATGHETEPPFGRDVPWTKVFLAHPVPFKPGTHFLYNTPATYMLSAIVQKVTGEKVVDYLRPRLFEPLGIENPTWGESPQGISLGGYGLSVRTEDIAKLGQLYLQKGQWNGEQLISESWAVAATSRQVSNGSNPLSDWDQGYGYQFWRSQHNAFRGDGAFGQYCLVMPDQDAVVAITSGVRDMQAVLDLIWERLLPAMQEASLPANSDARERLAGRLASLVVRPAPGEPTSRLASTVSGKWYTFPENERGIEAMRFEFDGNAPSITVRTQEGESRIPFSNGEWTKSEVGFVNGLERMLGLPPEAASRVGASGAWPSEDTFALKLALYETPYYTNLNFHFNGGTLTLDSEYNVAFGPSNVPSLTATAD